jgi:2-polyprenyl-3-methyl-5-hydroxy-6-metoxy-1,4-benzoquinol methylase
VAERGERYTWKEIPGSSHDWLHRRILALPAGLRLLDVGAAGGHLGRAVRSRCAYLAGVEPDPGLPESAREGYDEWRAKDLAACGDWAEPFDVVVFADVLEHVARPEDVLARARGWLRHGGRLFVSLPNVANVTVRAALLLGRFSYADRGILDRTHLRFYTRRTATRLITDAGFDVRSVTATAMPYELALPRVGWVVKGLMREFATASARVWPTLFGYQFVFEAEKR